MVGVVSLNPNGGNFIFADCETPQCQFCTKMKEMSDLCYLGKTRLADIYDGGTGDAPYESIVYFSFH